MARAPLVLEAMQTLSSLVAVVSLLLAVAFVPLVGAALFVIVFFGLFLLAMVGVFSGVENRAVRQQNPSMNPKRWRDGG
jgi:uncharacterized membrane protein HdeD (DUF308 family)